MKSDCFKSSHWSNFYFWPGDSLWKRRRRIISLLQQFFKQFCVMVLQNFKFKIIPCHHYRTITSSRHHHHHFVTMKSSSSLQGHGLFFTTSSSSLHHHQVIIIIVKPPYQHQTSSSALHTSSSHPLRYEIATWHIHHVTILMRGEGRGSYTAPPVTTI